MRWRTEKRQKLLNLDSLSVGRLAKTPKLDTLTGACLQHWEKRPAGWSESQQLFLEGLHRQLSSELSDRKTI